MPPVPVPAVQAPTPVGAGFAASLSHNRFAALASPTQMFDPSTHSTTEQAATVDSDFTFEFATSQGIPPTLSSHNKSALKLYIGTACHSDMTSPSRLPSIQETCVSTAKSTEPVKVDTSHIGIADSGATNHVFFGKSHISLHTLPCMANLSLWPTAHPFLSLVWVQLALPSMGFQSS
jgi:hypothetical protein